MNRLQDQASHAGATMEDKQATLKMMSDKDALLKREMDALRIAVRVGHKVCFNVSNVAVFC